MHLDVSQKRDYLIACGLRGPDDTTFEGEDMKFITTAVVRHLVGVSDNCGAVVADLSEAQRMWAVWHDTRREAVKVKIASHHHFYDHILRALNAIRTTEAKAAFDWMRAVLRDTGRSWLPLDELL